MSMIKYTVTLLAQQHQQVCQYDGGADDDDDGLSHTIVYK